VTRKRVIIAAVLAAFVVIAGWYAGFYRPEISHIKNLQTKQQQAEESYLQLETHYASLLRSKKQLPKQRLALTKLKGLVPDGPELDKLVTTLYAAATATGVNLSTISSPAPVGFGTSSGSAASSGPGQLSLSLSITGTSSQIESFVKALDGAPRLFVVDNFSLSFGSSKGGKSTAGNSQGGTVISVRAFYADASSQNAAS
jgi:Tfp pilus assembly protein PilO